MSNSPEPDIPTTNLPDKSKWSDSSEDFLSHFKGNQIFFTVFENKATKKALKDAVKDIPKPKHFPGKLKTREKELRKLNGEDRGVFFTVHEMKGKRRIKTEVMRCRSIWIDDDVVRDSPRTDFPLPPNLIVNSSPGKYHYYWLTSTTNFDEWDAVMATMVKEHGCDNSSKDLARVMRLPGFNHNKKKPFPVKYRVISDQPYEWEKIKKHYPPIFHTDKQGKKKAGVYKSQEDHIQAIITGEGFHSSLQSVIANHANNTTNKSSLMLIARGLVQEALLSGKLSDNRTTRAHGLLSDDSTEIQEMVDWAVNSNEDEKRLPPVHIKKNQEAPGFPEELMFTDDDYGRYIKDVMESTPHRSNPVAAFVQGHSMIQHCTGPFATEVDDTTAGMSIAVGPTKVGKTLAAKAARKYLPLPAMKQRYAQLGTAEGLQDLISMVQSRPDLLFQIDEIGFLFREIKSKKSSGGLWGELLELATIDTGIYTTRPLAGKEPVAIYAPHITLIGSTTEAALCGGLTQEEIDTGGVNRILLFNVANNVSIKRQAPKRPDNAHIDRLECLYKLGVMDPMKRMNEPPIVHMAPDLIDHIYDIEDKDMTSSNLRGRHIELAKAWAMGRALFNNPKSPVLDIDIFDWGYAVANCSFKYTEHLFDTVLSASEISKIEDDLVRKLSKLGGDARRGDALNIRTWKRLGSHRREQTLAAMEKARVIKCYDKTKSSGRTELRIRLIDG